MNNSFEQLNPLTEKEHKLNVVSLGTESATAGEFTFSVYKTKETIRKKLTLEDGKVQTKSVNADLTGSVVKNETGWEDMLSFVKETGEVESHFQTCEIKVQAKIFKNIMMEENITHIDYLSLDVEGHELNVLKGIDFNTVKINVLTIENNPPSCVVYGDEKIRKLMFSNNFLLWGRTVGLDDIYVSKDFLVSINK